MKTRIATLTLLFGLFISVTAFANQPVPASKVVAASIADYIEEEMEYPGQIKVIVLREKRAVEYAK